MNNRLLPALVLLAIVSLLRAEPPPAPIVAPTGRMQWKMTVVPEDKNVPAREAVGRPSVTGLEYTRGKDGITRIVVSSQDGKRGEFWAVGKYYLYRRPVSGKISVLASSSDWPGPHEYASQGFYGAERLDSAEPQGVVEFEKTPCLYFRGNDGAYEAWFDAATGLPKAIRLDGRKFLFEFGGASFADPVLGAEWATAWEKFRKNMARSGLPL